MPFSEFRYAQFRLWLYEALKLVTHGQGRLPPADEPLLWGIAERVVVAFATGGVSEADVLDVVALVSEDLGYKKSGRPGTEDKRPCPPC